MAKGRSDDPQYFIHVPTPEGYATPYTVVPTDPLKLHLGIITTLYTIDPIFKERHAEKKTGSRLLQPIRGPENLVRNFFDTTDLAQDLKGYMQELELELRASGDVGEHLVAILEAISSELPQLFEHISLGEIHRSGGALKGFCGKIKAACNKIAGELRVKSETIDGLTLSNDRVLDTIQNLNAAHQEMYIKWGVAVEGVLKHHRQITELGREVDGALDEARKSHGEIVNFLNPESPALFEISEYLREGDGEFALAVSRFLDNPAACPDIKGFIARAHVLMGKARQMESDIRDRWQKVHDTYMPSVGQVMQDIELYAHLLTDAYMQFARFRTELGADAVKPYELDAETLCSEKDFNDALKLVSDTGEAGEELKQKIEDQLERLSALVTKAPPSLPRNMAESFQMALYNIRMCEDALSIPYSDCATLTAPIVGGSQNGHVDPKRVETLYGIIIGIAYPLTCSSQNFAQTTVHSLLHIAEKLGKCTEEEVRLYRKALAKRLHRSGERVTASVDPETEKGNQIKLWKNASKGVLWVQYRNKGKWCLKLVESAAPRALELMEKHDIKVRAVCEAKEARDAEKKLLKESEGRWCRCRPQGGGDTEDDDEE